MLGTSLLDSDKRLDTLCPSVCLVDLRPLSKCDLLQILTIVVGSSLCMDDVFDAAKILVQKSRRKSLVGLGVTLGCSSSDQDSLVVSGKGNVKGLAVGKSRVLKLVERLEIAFLQRELHGAAALCVPILFPHETSVAAGQFPAQGIWNGDHILAVSWK